MTVNTGYLFKFGFIKKEDNHRVNKVEGRIFCFCFQDQEAWRRDGTR